MDVQQLIYNYLPQKFLARLHKSYYLSLSSSYSLGHDKVLYLKTRFTNNIEHHKTVHRLGIQVYLFETLNRK